MLEQIIFLFLVFIIVAGAFYIAFSHSVLKSAYVFMLLLLSVAGIFVFAGADFSAVSQIMVYIGGILILIVFGILLTPKKGDKNSNNPIELNTKNYNQFIGIALGIVVFASLFWAISKSNFDALGSFDKSNPKSTVQQVGFNLISKYGIELEAIGLLLLAALMGAGAIAQKLLSKQNG